MKRIGTMVLALVAALALSGLGASQTFALPDISITLQGSSYPLHLNWEDATAKWAFATAVSTVAGEGVKLLLLTNSLSALGTFHATFMTAVTEGGRKCNSVGDPVRTVLSEGSFHVVYTSLSPLLLGILFLPKEITIECEGLEYVVKGSVISSLIAAGNNATELTSVQALMLGNIAGQQEIRNYWNDAGQRLTATLLMNANGGAFREADLTIAELMLLTALPPTGSTVSNMFLITSR